MPGSKRPAKYPGPRCFTHHKAKNSSSSAARKAAYIEATYSITEEERSKILEFQGGVCYICRRAKDTARRRLAVDHDHSCCPGKTSCGKCVRGLLCRGCNRYVLGHLRDSTEALIRGVEYLNDPPAQRVLKDKWNVQSRVVRATASM